MFGFSVYVTITISQSLETVSATSTGDLQDQRNRPDERALEKEEEDYFNEGRWVSISLI